MNIKKSLLRWTVAALAVLMLAACGSSTTSQPTTSSPATENSSAQKAQTGQVSFNVQFPQAAIKKALMDNRTVSVNVQWFAYSNSNVIGSVTLTPDASGLASATVDVPVGNIRFMAIAQDSNLVELDKVSAAGEITSGSNTVTMTFLGGDWQFVDASGNPLPQTFGTTTLAGFTLKSQGVYYGGAAKATIDPTKPKGWSDYRLQWQDSTTAFGPLMWAGQTTQFNASVGTGNSFGSDWLNITDPARSDNMNGSSPYLAGDRLVWLMDWEDGDGPGSIVDANNVDLIPQFQAFGNTQVLDGNHLGGYLMAMTFDSLTQSAPIATNVDCNLFWYAQQVTPAAARATAIKASLTKSATKAAIGDDTTLTAGTATVNYTECDEDYTATQIDGNGDGDNLWEELTYDANGNWRYDAGDLFIDSDGDQVWDYNYYPGTTYDVTEVYSNVVAREFLAKGSQAGSVYPEVLSSYVGTYSGSLYDSSSNTTGTVTFSVDSNGLVTNGTVVDFTSSLTYNMSTTGSMDLYSGTFWFAVWSNDGNYISLSGTPTSGQYAYNGSMFWAGSYSTTKVDVPASAVGTWIMYNTATANTAILTFIDSNNYMMGEDGAPDTGGAPGIEVGTYIFDPATSATTFTASYETNGDRGATIVGTPTTYPVLGLTESTLTVGDPIDGTPFTFSRVVPDPTNPVVGSWHFTGTGMGSTILVLLNNGQYYAVQVDDIDTNNRFFESGTYTWNNIDGTFVGTGVFSSNTSNSAIAAPGDINSSNVTILGNNLIFFDGVGTYTATRL